MAQKPDGSSAKTDRVTFTRPAAERIAKVVRAVEGGSRNSAPLSFGRMISGGGGGGSSVRFATYTATSNWSVVGFAGSTNTNNTKKIQFAFPTTTPFATAMCVNHLSPIPLVTTNATAAIAVIRILALKDGGEWRLIGAQA